MLKWKESEVVEQETWWKILIIVQKNFRSFSVKYLFVCKKILTHSKAHPV